MTGRLFAALDRLDQRLTRHGRLLGALLAALLAGALAAYNIASGPLSNLNDIGGWSNRALFIAMTACVHGALLLVMTLLCRERFSRLALRQLILTAGMVILLTAINQKTYAYVKGLQPLVRAMDEQGLAAAAHWEPNLSAPAMTLLYLITRGPVYDMYLVKLACIGCYLLLAVLLMYAADRMGLFLRAEALLTFAVILPQGFMNAACSAQLEIIAVCLLGVSLALAFGREGRPTASALCYGAACALCGACLYALPVYVYLMRQGRMKGMHLGMIFALSAALCLPAAVCGMPLGEAVFSPLRAILGTPAHASGAPNIMSLIARPLMEETPEYAQMLRHLPALDAVANAQQDYTPAHYVVIARGFAFAGLALYMGVCALVLKAKRMSAFERVLALALAALLGCPGVSSGAWIALDLLCLMAVFAWPKLRLPACMLLFATAGASCYPMTEETMLPMAAAAILGVLALCMLLGIIPMAKEAGNHE